MAMEAIGRLTGIDVARGLAVMGMFVAHTANDGPAETLADGRSSVLFATIAGMSLGLITGGARPVEGRRRRDSRISVALRALVLIVLGFGLWYLGGGIAVILDYYGVMFLVLLPVLFAPRWLVAVVGLAAAIGGPFVVRALGEDRATPFSQVRLSEILVEWTVTGWYPGIVWVAYLCAGLIAARSDLARRRTQVAMLLAGSGSSLLGYGGARLLGLDASEHSNTTGEVLGSGGLAVAVVGALLLLCGSPGVGAVVSRVLSPLADVGSMPLTIYTLQVFVLVLWLNSPFRGTFPTIQSWPLLVTLIVVSFAFAMVWRRTQGRGPLEQVMAQLTTVDSSRQDARPVR